MKQIKFILSFSLIIVLLFSCKKDDCKGDPKIDCVCIELFDPVCGCDNVTYGNACKAQCAGIKDFTKGECN